MHGGTRVDLLACMEAFVCVAEAQSFSGAARQMRVAPSVVTTRIQQFEGYLGRALFHRSTRAVRLSEEGKTYLQACQDILSRTRSLPLLLDYDKDVVRGVLRIRVLPSLAAGYFPAILSELRSLYPNLALEVEVDDRLADPVQDGLDVVLQIFPAVSEALIERKLFPHRGVFVASRNYLRQRAPLATPDDLAQSDFACYSYYPWGDHWPLTRAGAKHVVHLSPVLRTNSVQLLRDFVCLGAGVSYLPTMLVANDIMEARLERVLDEYTAPLLWLRAVYPASHRNSAKVQIFVDYLARYFSAEPQWDSLLRGREEH